MAWNAVTDVNDGQSYGGGAWQSGIDAIEQLQDALGPDVPALTSYTPTFRQGVALTKTVNLARYLVSAGLCTVSIDLAATSAGTAAVEIVASLPPVTPFAGAGALPCGNGIFYDASTGAQYPAYVMLVGADFKLFPTNATGTTPLGVAQFTGAVAIGDIFRAHFSFPVAP